MQTQCFCQEISFTNFLSYRTSNLNVDWHSIRFLSAFVFFRHVKVWSFSFAFLYVQIRITKLSHAEQKFSEKKPL